MSQSYEEYKEEYDTYLSRTRSFLSSTRSLSTLRESDRLLREARRCAHAMRGLAEVEDDPSKVLESTRRIDREVRPLAEEVSRALAEREEEDGGGRDELFGDARGSLLDPDGEGGGGDTERLIRDSESLLLESQALCAESEQTGSSTLLTMGTQREQLLNASEHVRGTMDSTERARRVLREMRFRALRNKMFLYSVIAALIVANGAVLYRLVKK